MKLRLLIAALAMLAEALAVAACARGAVVPSLALHLVAAGVMAEAFARAGGGHDRAALVTAWFWTATFPPLGLLAGAFLLASVGRGGKAAAKESWETRRRRAAEAALADQQRARVITADVVPLADALGDADANVRIGAVDALARRPSRAAVQLLAQARENDLYDVRFRAVEVLGRIGSQKLEAIAEARRRVAARPRSTAALAELARLCVEYAGLGLDTPDVGRAHLAEAVAAGSRALAMARTLDPALALLVGKAQRDAGALDAAEATHRRLADAAPDHPGVLVALAETQLLRRDFVALADTCARLRERGHLLDDALAGAVELWSADHTTRVPEWAGR